jgi:hypothetical protein
MAEKIEQKEKRHLKAWFHEAEFFDRNEISLCLFTISSAHETKINFDSVEKFRLVENRL